MRVFLTEAEYEEVDCDNDGMSAAPGVSLPVTKFPLPIKQRVHFYSIK